MNAYICWHYVMYQYVGNIVVAPFLAVFGIYSAHAIHHCIHLCSHGFHVAPHDTVEMLVVPVSFAEETAFQIKCPCSEATLREDCRSSVVRMVCRVGCRIMAHSRMQHAMVAVPRAAVERFALHGCHVVRVMFVFIVFHGKHTWVWLRSIFN